MASHERNDMTTPTEKNLWSVRETAARLGISERTLHSHTAPRGTLKCVKIGVRIGFRPETVEAWLKDREGNETAEGKNEPGHKEHKGGETAESEAFQ